MNTPHQAIRDSDPKEWEGDALNRHRYSIFLSNYINGRIAKTNQPLTLALDAAWGSGKTFFVKKWSEDINTKKGGAIIFDAWKNDFSSEVLVSFMAELLKGMKPLRDRISKTEKAKSAINNQSKKLMNGFRKAAIPAAGVIAKGIFHKVTGVAVNDLFEALENDATTSPLESITQDMEKDLEKGLETFFEKTLEAHQARSDATEEFKIALAELIEILQKENSLNGPLYVFIDELDRCRPDYAIKLLEGIKHLFTVKEVVFVVSTNISQLSKSVQAVYGNGFDGYSYLKRFFDFEFTLPAPDIYSFAQVLINELPLFEGRNLDYGLHQRAYTNDNKLARSFELIATACNLSLRTQRQVWMIASAAATGIPTEYRISTLWLFFLSVLKHGHPEILEKLNEKTLSPLDFIELCKPAGNFTTTTATSFQIDIYGRSIGNHQHQDNKIPLLNILQVYHQAVFQTIDEIANISNKENSQYPLNLIDHMTEERPNPFNSGEVYRPSIRNYHELVKLSGQMR